MITSTTPRFLVAAFFGAVLMAGTASAADPNFKYVDLGTLGGDQAAAFGLNDSRQVGGWSTIPGCTTPLGNPCRRAFLWDDGVMTDLGLLSGDEESTARAINNAGLVVGTSESGVIAGFGVYHAFEWNGSMSPLPDLGSGQSWVNDVNNSGLMVGYAPDPSVTRDRVVTWQSGAITNVGASEGHSYNRGYGVSDGGLLAGFAWNLFSPNDAILFAGGWVTIGGFGQFQNAEASDVNDNGTACGLMAFPSGNWHAALWTQAEALDLGVLPGMDLGNLSDVNEAGHAVGSSYTDVASRAIYYDGETMRDLNELLPAGVDVLLWEANEINENGDIAGVALVAGKFRAFLLMNEPWVDLGGGTAGINGVPALEATGPLVAGSDLTLELTDAPSNALMAGWLSLASTPVPALGGTLHATPNVLQLLVFANGSGEWTQSLSWPAGVPMGTEPTVQLIVQDLSVPAQITLSNAVMATTP